MDIANGKVVVWFQVPTVHDATREPHTDPTWAALEDTLITTFGGLTRGADVTGAWRAPDGKLIREPSRTYEVDVTEDQLNEVETILRAACATFGQQCLRVKIEDRALYLTP